MRHYYETIKLSEGQLIRVNPDDYTLIDFFNNHKHVREITDEKLKNIAPYLQHIIQPQDPYSMRTEDIINELRSYGIFADRYSFSSKLSMQLDIARKMKKRNFLTVIENGRPIFLDHTKSILPSLNTTDDELEEPEEPDLEEESYYEIEQEENIVAAIDDSTDPDNLRPKGMKDFEDWVQDTHEELENATRLQIEKEKEIQKMLFSEQDYTTPVQELDDRFKQKGIEDEEIEEINYRKYLPVEQSKPFVYEPVTTEEKLHFRDIKWTKINIEVLELIIRNEGLEYETEVKSPIDLRWNKINAVKDKYESVIEKDRFAVMVNMLQKRFKEIADREPDYRSFKHMALKKRVTELSKYGYDVWYNESVGIKKHAMKMYALAKMGLQIPQTQEEVDELLVQEGKSKLI